MGGTRRKKIGQYILYKRERPELAVKSRMDLGASKISRFRKNTEAEKTVGGDKPGTGIRLLSTKRERGGQKRQESQGRRLERSSGKEQSD